MSGDKAVIEVVSSKRTLGKRDGSVYSDYNSVPEVYKEWGRAPKPERPTVDTARGDEPPSAFNIDLDPFAYIL